MPGKQDYRGAKLQAAALPEQQGGAAGRQPQQPRNTIPADAYAEQRT